MSSEASDQAYWEPLTQEQYDSGREKRLQANRIRPKSWYNTRHIVNMDESLDYYAVQFTIEVIEVRPIDDMFLINSILLSIDGKKASEVTPDIVTEDGLIVIKQDPRHEGYLLDANEGLDFDLPHTKVEDKIETSKELVLVH